MSATLLFASATEVGEGSNVGRPPVHLVASSSSLQLAREKTRPFAWVQKARLAACNQEARKSAPGGWNMVAGHQDLASKGNCSGQGGWHRVMPRYWWRNKAGTGRFNGDINKAKRSAFSSDCCFRCLVKDHKIAHCRFPICYIRCRASSHLARLCPQKTSHRFRNTLPQPPPPPSFCPSFSEQQASPKRMDGYSAG